MGVFLMHPGIAMPNQLLPDLRDDAAIRQLADISVPQGMKSLAAKSAAPAFTRGDAARNARLLDKPSELTGETPCPTNTLSGQVRKNISFANPPSRLLKNWSFGGY
jgi:hypothetical protein